MRYINYKKCAIWNGSPHSEDKMNCQRADDLLKNLNVFMLRNVYNFDIQKETSFWYIIKDHFGGMEELSSKTRNQVRRSFNRLEIRKITSELLVEEGYEVYCSAYESYNDHTMWHLPTKEEYVANIRNHSNRDYWGCIDRENNKLIAYAINIIHEDMCEYASMKAIPSYLTGYYPYYGLLYMMNEYYLVNQNLKYVSDGARTLTEHSNIQEFLCNKFKFRKAYCEMKIYYIWWLKLSVNLLFPFQNYIPIKVIKNVLKQESMARNKY